MSRITRLTLYCGFSASICCATEVIARLLSSPERESLLDSRARFTSLLLRPELTDEIIPITLRQFGSS